MNTGQTNKNQGRTPCEVWTRAMGYYRPISHFNLGKKSEHMSRKHYLECIESNKFFCEAYSC